MTVQHGYLLRSLQPFRRLHCTLPHRTPGGLIIVTRARVRTSQERIIFLAHGMDRHSDLQAVFLSMKHTLPHNLAETIDYAGYGTCPEIGRRHRYEPCSTSRYALGRLNIRPDCKYPTGTPTLRLFPVYQTLEAFVEETSRCPKWIDVC